MSDPARLYHATDRALRRLGFRQTVRGAIIVGLLIGLMMGAQGPAYNAAYPTKVERQAFVSTLKTVPALGFMAGETANASEPASYSIYKSLPIVTMITAIWGLLTVTRLLRGQEEDGRLELLLAGNTTKRGSARQLLLGFAGSFTISLLIACISITALGRLPHVDLTVTSAALLTLGVYLPGVLFAGLGVLTSQLARTRGRAVMYGLVPLLILFVVRGAGNSAADLNWLKNISPFGWVDLLNPVLHPSAIWLLPSIVLSALFVTAGIYFAGRRDLGESLLHESDIARSRFGLLGSPLAIALRQHIWTFLWWALGTLALTGLFTGLAKLSVDILKNASGAQAIIAKLGGGESGITLAFIGIGVTLNAMIMLAMTIVLVAHIRRDEAKGYLDNILTHAVGRQAWLIGRLVIIMTIVMSITFAAALLSWFVAHHIQHIDAIQLSSLLQSSVSSIAVIVFVLGVGVVFYGWFPRLAVIAMTVVVAWSYAVDILRAIIKLNDVVLHTSLLGYLSTPATPPNWSAILWLCGLGILMTALGAIAFTKRDIVSE